MMIDGMRITIRSEWDGKPYKNHLPCGLKERMKTENQWLEAGFLLKSGATGYEMHPHAMTKKLFTYYIDTDVVEFSEKTASRNCLTCKIRTGRFCVFAGDYVSANNCCSEWSFIKSNG